MDKNIAALLCVDHAELTDFRAVMSRHMQQSTVTNLPAHLGIKWRSIQNDVERVRLFARHDCFDN